MVPVDLLIIGAGPIGLACGIEAKKNNINYLIIDKGCLVNSLYHYPQNMTFFSTSDKLEIGDIPFISHNPKPTRNEALEYFRRLTLAWKLKMHLHEKIVSVEKKDSIFITKSEKNTYTSQFIILATGFYDRPTLLGVEGENLPKVKHYYNDPHPYFNMNVAIVGAANSAVDIALETYRKGAQSVTLIIRDSALSKRVKYWVRPDIENRINEGTIQAHFNSQIDKITPNEIEIITPQGRKTLPNDYVLAMTGYEPDFDFLTNLGIQLQDDPYKTPYYDPESMETNIEGVYLAGVICGGLKTSIWFIENSIVHAVQIMNHIKEKIKQYS